MPKFTVWLLRPVRRWDDVETPNSAEAVLKCMSALPEGLLTKDNEPYQFWHEEIEDETGEEGMFI